MAEELNCYMNEQLNDPSLRNWLALIILLLSDNSLKKWDEQMSVRDKLSN